MECRAVHTPLKMFGFFLQQNMKIGGSSKQSKYSELANLLLNYEVGDGENAREEHPFLGQLRSA